MSLRFTKMHGVGNDFIVLDFEGVEGRDLREVARLVCDRHFGIGADGILVTAPSEVADLRMIYHNSDGSPSEMCGNGIRCLARYAKDNGLVDSGELTVETGAGVKTVTLRPDGSSRVELGPPGFGGPVHLRGHEFVRVSMGNPHAVAFLGSDAEVEALDLTREGPEIENDPAFPDGTNVEFVYVRGPGDIRMRIWERGAGETLASGSGSCASAVAAIHSGKATSPVSAHLDGGVVTVEWSGETESPVFMIGPAEYVCEGRFLRL